MARGKAIWEAAESDSRNGGQRSANAMRFYALARMLAEAETSVLTGSDAEAAGACSATITQSQFLVALRARVYPRNSRRESATQRLMQRMRRKQSLDRRARHFFLRFAAALFAADAQNRSSCRRVLVC